MARFTRAGEECKMEIDDKVLIGTEVRNTIKKALKTNTLSERLKIFMHIPFGTFVFYPKEKDQTDEDVHKTHMDIYKTVAFQMAQTSALMDGNEIYSKEEVVEFYPKLKNFMFRTPDTLDFLSLIFFRDAFVAKIKSMFDEDPGFSNAMEILQN